MIRRLETRLRQQRREDKRPPPVWIWYGRGITPDQAFKAACEANRVPPGSWVVLLPESAHSHEEWMVDVQAEYAMREERNRQADEHSIS